MLFGAVGDGVYYARIDGMGRCRGSRLSPPYHASIRVHAGRPGHLVVGGAHLESDADGGREVGHGGRRDV